MTIRQPSDLKAFFETGDRPTQAQFSDLIDSSAPDHFTTVAALLADTTASYPTGMTLTAAGYRYTVAASGASDHHLTNAGGAKLYFQRAGIRVSPKPSARPETARPTTSRLWNCGGTTSSPAA